ncbi:MAG: GNAT family N-acetyltransferase [Bacteroidia bacterium]
MIRFVNRKNINIQKWDALVSGSSNTSIFGYSWYLDAVCENWGALIMDEYEAVFPLVFRSRYNISYVYQPFFTRYFGVFAKGKVTAKTMKEFLEEIPAKFRFVDICIPAVIDVPGFTAKEKKFQELDMAAKHAELSKAYSDNAKRNIKKALKAGLKIRPDIAPEKVVNLFRSTKGGELEIFKPEDYKRLIRLMNACNASKKGQSIAVYDGEKLCAAGFFMFSNGRFTFLKSGVTEEGKAKGAMHLLFDYFILQNSGRKYILDFGGSSVDGVARFYRNFGAKDCVYLQLQKNNLPRLVKWVKSLK